MIWYARFLSHILFVIDEDISSWTLQNFKLFTHHLPWIPLYDVVVDKHISECVLQDIYFLIL
jgi:hypothetical protein